LANKKKRKFGNPAAEAARRKRTATVIPEPQDSAQQVQAQPVPIEANPSVTALASENEMLRNAYQSLKDQSVDLAEDFNRVLQSYAALVTNSFKLGATMDEFDPSDPRTLERLKSKLSFFTEDLPRNCERAGIRIPDLKDLDYSAALNVQVLNAEDFEPLTPLVIDEVVEPILIYDPKNSSLDSKTVGGLLKSGLVTVKRKGD
jgi:hypothetical protein